MPRRKHHRGKRNGRPVPTLSDPSTSRAKPPCASLPSKSPRKKRLVHGAASAPVQQRATQKALDQPGLFRCPREIRDMVYDLLWKDTPHMSVAWDATGNHKNTSRARVVITAIYDSWPDRQNGSGSALPQWLLTNTQILAEGLEQFQNRGVWYVSDPSEISRDLAMQHLLHPSAAEDIIVCLENLFNVYHLEGFPTQLKRQWAKPKHDSLAALYQLLLENGNGEPRLKVLEFRTTMRYLQLDYHPQLYEFFIGLQKACADEEVENDDDDEEDDDEHLWYYYPDDAPDLDIVIHDDYPLTGLDEDLFDISYLVPPVALRSGIKQLHVQMRYPDNHAVPPFPAQEMMYGGMSKLLCVLFPNHDMSTTLPRHTISATTKPLPESTREAHKNLDMTAGRVLDTDGAGERYDGERWEFRCGPFRSSRERERGGTWIVRKRDGCELEYFPDCLKRFRTSARNEQSTLSTGRIHSTFTWPLSAATLSAFMATRKAPMSKSTRNSIATPWPSTEASTSLQTPV